MPRKCETCIHPQARRIDLMLKGGSTLTYVAGKFGIPASSLQRHKANHLRMGAKPSAAKVEPTVSTYDLDTPAQILDSAKNIVARTDRLVTQAEAEGDVKTAISGVKLMLDALTQFFAKYHRMLEDAPRVDQSTKIIAVLSNTSEEDLRAFLAGGRKALPDVSG